MGNRTVRWMSYGALIGLALFAMGLLAAQPVHAQTWRTLNCAQGNANGPCHPTQYKDTNGNLQDVDATHPLPTSASVGDVTVTPFVTASTTDKGGTITAGGTAQTAIASNASRKAYCIINDPAETEVLMVRLNGTASATAGVPVRPGVPACSGAGTIDTAAVSVWAATTSHRWFGYEAQ